MFDILDADKLPMVQWIAIKGNLVGLKTRLVDSDGVLVEGLGAESFKIVDLIIKMKEKEVIAIVEIYKTRSAAKYIMDHLDSDLIGMKVSEYKQEWEFTPLGASYFGSLYESFNRGIKTEMCVDMVLYKEKHYDKDRGVWVLK